MAPTTGYWVASSLLTSISKHENHSSECRLSNKYLSHRMQTDSVRLLSIKDKCAGQVALALTLRLSTFFSSDSLKAAASASCCSFWLTLFLQIPASVPCSRCEVFAFLLFHHDMMSCRWNHGLACRSHCDCSSPYW